MMTGPILLVASWAMRSSTAFTNISPVASANRCRLFSSSSDVMAAAVHNGVSRLSTLQSLLTKHGAPGSRDCTAPNDLRPVVTLKDTPELVTSLTGSNEELSNLHPHLFPIAKSSISGNFICALRRAYASDASYESSNDAPWPLVEAQLGGPGMRLLALNSEHFMRRIACEADFAGDGKETVAMYNDGLGCGLMKESGLDAPYQPGSVASLGYGVDKYVLLRVGPFPDLYEAMAIQHAARGDESSSLIAAETSNSKFSSFGSTFKFHAKLLASFNRKEEARDSARVCLRLPLPSTGLTQEDFRDTAILAQLADESDSIPVAMTKLRAMYEKILASEQDDATPHQGKTPEQRAIDEANYLLDTVALSGGKWSDIRQKLACIYASAGRDDMAIFVDPSYS